MTAPVPQMPFSGAGRGGTELERAFETFSAFHARRPQTTSGAEPETSPTGAGAGEVPRTSGSIDEALCPRPASQTTLRPYSPPPWVKGCGTISTLTNPWELSWASRALWACLGQILTTSLNVALEQDRAGGLTFGSLRTRPQRRAERPLGRQSWFRPAARAEGATTTPKRRR